MVIVVCMHNFEVEKKKEAFCYMVCSVTVLHLFFSSIHLSLDC